MSDTAADVRTLVLDAITGWVEPDDAQFEELALRVFRFQFAHVPPYRAYCERRARTPADVERWEDIPAVPTAAFREVAFMAGEAADAEAVFRTSGTTRGAERRGAHHILDLSIYHAALLRSFADCVLPDGARPLMISLIPAASELPESSLSHMVTQVTEQFGARDSATFADARAGIDYDAVGAALRCAERAARPVCLLGTSFAFVHWLDHLAERRTRFRLPAGSRLMDTGGFKGRSRTIREPELRALYRDRFGIDDLHVVNEYGMTEMCSQFYDAGLRDHVLAVSAPRRKLVPPWVRTRVVQPETLEPVPAGAPGILRHHDLANVFSVAAIQTEDMGSALADGFTLFGRAPGASPRGCSIAMDLLLQSIGRTAG
jgi:hypothetical protein